MRSGYTEWRGPGVAGFLAARERYIDDVLQDALDEGIRQVVILGAGYDARALRFAFPEGVKIFEVDHPATQQDKLAQLRRIFGQVPETVTYVPVDFNTQTLHARLLECGFDTAAKTLFIWQGVSMYLTPEAVDSTLTFVATHAAGGSAIVFDYLYREVLTGQQKQNEVGNMRRYRFMTGEGLTFGIAAGQIETFLRARGFTEIRDIDAQGLKDAYFHGVNASRKVVGGYGIVVGVVK
jgi:methyltransferase (TIGR00027 family)